MTTISDFLAARLDETKAAAEAAGGAGPEGRWSQRDPVRQSGRIVDGDGSVIVYDEGSPTKAEAAHIVLHDPARMLREVKAGCLLLAELAVAKLAYEQARSVCINTRDRAGVAKYDATVSATYAAWRSLQRVASAQAAVWSDHADWREGMT